MCGRYGTWDLNWSAVTAPLADLGRPAPPAGFEPRVSLAPHQNAPIIHLPDRDRGKSSPSVPVATLARWDLVPHWWSKPLEEKRFPSFNARIETLAEKPTFRDAFRHRRCLVPVSYFIEWRAEGKGKQPYRIGRRDGRPLLLAGLWAPWRGRSRGEAVELVSFTIVVGEPNALVKRIHDRMPVILDEDQAGRWLTASPEQALQAAAVHPATPLQAVPITRRINRVRDAEQAGPDWLEPVGEALSPTSG